MKSETLSEIDNLITQIEAGYEISSTRWCPDPSLGATHYLNKALVIKDAGRLPSWIDKMEHLVTIGNHDFYKEKK
jgi:hypothetical protein